MGNRNAFQRIWLEIFGLFLSSRWAEFFSFTNEREDCRFLIEAKTCRIEKALWYTVKLLLRGETEIKII